MIITALLQDKQDLQNALQETLNALENVRAERDRLSAQVYEIQRKLQASQTSLQELQDCLLTAGTLEDAQYCTE